MTLCLRWLISNAFAHRKAKLVGIPGPIKSDAECCPRFSYTHTIIFQTSGVDQTVELLRKLSDWLEISEG